LLHRRIREYVYHPDSFAPLALVESVEGCAADRVLAHAPGPPRADGDSARSRPLQVYYYHNAPNGCPTRLSDARGRIVWAARYDTGGRVKGLLTNEISNAIRLQGQYEDEETGLYYNRSRYYDPDTCAFVNQDTIRLLGGPHLYEYAANTLSWIDPYGTDCKSEFRTWVLKQIWDKNNHPLRFLLVQDNGKFLRRFHKPPTRRHEDLIDHPHVFEAGHLVSKHSGEPELLAVQAGWENQYDNISGENKGVIIERAAIDVGGVPVELRTAEWWEDAGYLPRGTVAQAVKTGGWSAP
jgi:RHS repeat-associated protein